MERLDKILSSQGICSRKEVKNFIKNKRITINGIPPIKSDTKVDPQSDIIKIDGETLNYQKFIYIMMNKPKGVLSASTDRRAETVIDLLPENLRRKNLFPAGRLDKDTTGLLIITDDGEFAHNMLSPKKHVRKLYRAVLDGELTDDKKAVLENGITLSDGTIFKPAKVYINDENNRCEVEIEICEGKFHQVKKMFAFVGLTVTELNRLRIGELYLDENLRPSECRLMSGSEIQSIFRGNNS